jgi:hypothetical protein
MFIGVLQFIFCFIATILVDKLGRKFFLISGGMIVTISLITFGFVIIFLNYPVRGNKFFNIRICINIYNSIIFFWI